MKKPSIKLSSSIYLIIEVLVKLIPFMILPVLTNYWTKSEFGLFSLYIAILPILSILLDFGQRISIKRFFISYPKQIFSFIQVVNLLLIVIFLFIFCITLLFEVEILEKIENKYFLITIFLFTIIELYLSFLQISQKIILYNIIYFIKQTFPYLTILILILVNNVYINVSVFMFIQLFIFLILSIYIYFIVYKKIYFNINYKKYITYSLGISLPVIPAILSTFILSASDKYMISIYYSHEEVALYSISYTVGSILAMIVLALNKAWQPFILNCLKNKSYLKLKTLSRYYTLLVIILGILLTISSEYLLLFISNKSYLVGSEMIPEIIIGIFFYFLYTMYSNIAFYYKKMFLFALPAIIAATINIILNMYLLPLYSYKIAATTTMISYFIEFLIIYLISKKYFKINLL
ncbi:MAG TPA: hypothetical protein EYG89_00930 [Bacteroidia bacterium]|nr:hypothetical protein [Bacteroidia bacterium]